MAHGQVTRDAHVINVCPKHSRYDGTVESLDLSEDKEQLIVA